MGEFEYIVYDRETCEENTIQYRVSCPKWRPGEWNFTEEVFNRDMLGSMWYARFSCGKIAPEMADAFYDFLKSELDGSVIAMRKRFHELEGEPECQVFYDNFFECCPIYRGGAYWDKGWHPIDEQRKAA